MELFYVRPDGEVTASTVSADGAAFQPGVPKPLVQGRGDAGLGRNGRRHQFLFPVIGSHTTQYPFNVILNLMSLLKR